MKYIQAPEEYRGVGTYVFLAGGISGCPDWQTSLALQLVSTDLVLFSPRRDNFPMDDPSAAEGQIRWEFEHLRSADAISFWFPWETLCPIVLYELGAWSMTDKPIFVGAHPQYKRKQDVIIQTGLVRPEVQVVFSLVELAAQISRWSRK